MKAQHFLHVLTNSAVLLSLHLPGTGFAQEHSVKPSHATAPNAHLSTCSPDGKFFAVATARGPITYGRTSDGATLRTFYHCQPRAVAFSQDARLLASVGAGNGSQAGIKVWSLDDGKLLCQMATGVGSDPLLEFSPDGLLLATTSGGLNVDFWQLPHGTLRCSVPTPHAISSIAFSDDGNTVTGLGADCKPLRISVP